MSRTGLPGSAIPVQAERDTRIAAAAAQVAAALDTIRVNAERRTLAVAAAQRAIANAERDERDANTAADRQIRTGVGQLRADGLTVAAISELLQLPLPLPPPRAAASQLPPLRAQTRRAAAGTWGRRSRSCPPTRR